MKDKISDEWIRHNAPALYQHHVLERQLVFCPPDKGYGTYERRWLQRRSIPAAVLQRHFTKVSDAARFLGISPVGVHTAIKVGRIAGPRLFNYSRYATGEYEVWVRKAAVRAYAANRRRKR